MILMCEVLEVSSSGYYKWRQRRVSERMLRRVELLDLIIEVFSRSRETYGSPRVHRELEALGVHVNEKTVAKIMREHGMVARNRRPFKRTTDSKHELPIALNILNREFEAQEPDDVWVTDITYIRSGTDWSYLCVFIDLYSRMIVGWSLENTMPAELVITAFEQAIAKRGKAPRLVHSDRGSQYASEDFRKVLAENKCTQSMSRKGNCWDNAVSESFFGILKTEYVYHHKFETEDQLRLSLFDYIEIFYNRQRRHSTLNYMTPEEKVQKGRKAA